MIERLLFTALYDGIAELTANPTRLEQIFQTYHGLSATETASIRKVFEAKPPNVIHSYAREDSKFPLFAIVLNNEQETTKVLSDFGGFVDPDAVEAMYAETGAAEDLEDRAITTTFFRHVYDILIYTNHPDVTIYYYELMKYFLMRARDFFREHRLYDLTLSGGDLTPDRQYLPAYLFTRRLAFSCGSELPVIGQKAADTFQSIEGLHVADGRTDITALVNPVTSE